MSDNFSVRLGRLCSLITANSFLHLGNFCWILDSPTARLYQRELLFLECLDSIDPVENQAGQKIPPNFQLFRINFPEIYGWSFSIADLPAEQILAILPAKIRNSFDTNK